MAKMVVICAWCGSQLAETEGSKMDGVSHGICEPCRAEVEREYQKAREATADLALEA